MNKLFISYLIKPSLRKFAIFSIPFLISLLLITALGISADCATEGLSVGDEDYC